MDRFNNDTKYQRIKNYILDLINNKKLNYGDKIESENELAEKFSFSRHTVRQALGELVNEGYLIKIHGKGTFVAEKGESKPKNNRNTIGIITTYFSDYIFPSIIRGIDEVLSEADYAYILNCTFNDFQKERIALINMMEQNIKGLIIEPTRSALENPNIDLYKKLIDKGVKIVFIHGSYRELGCSCVVQDDAGGGYLAYKHLSEQGYKKIGTIMKYNDIQGRYREIGLGNAAKECGLDYGYDDILWFNDYAMPPDGLNLFRIDNNNQIKLTKKQIYNFIKEHDAIILYNEMIAITIINIIKKLGIDTPSDMGIVAFDNSEISKIISPKLTTIAHPKEELGRKAALQLLNIIDNNVEKLDDVKLVSEIIIRESSLKQNNL